MKIVDLIRKKRDGESHSEEEIRFIVKGAADNSISDYHLAAWLMAVYLRGMNDEEIVSFTKEMAFSGEVLDLSKVKGVKVDKHSTGGVGDKVSLVLGPLVSSAGVIFSKLSGRGLEHTGGTIDKLESIPGFKTNLSIEEFIKQLQTIGLAIAGQTQNLAPADGRLYTLRNVTATIDSLPLIIGSILSKKIAAGADVIILDVKYGSGAFMKDFKSAKILSQYLVSVGKKLGKSISVLLSDMNQPLGKNIGNSLEVIEAIETLKGNGPEDLTTICLKQGAILLYCGKLVSSLEEGENLLKENIKTGKALTKLEEMIKFQGGDISIIDDYNKLPQASEKIIIKSPCKGYITRLDALNIGKSVKLLGAGRDKKDDKIDLSVGLIINYKIGDYVEKEQPLVKLYVNDKSKLDNIISLVTNAFEFSNKKPEKVPLIGEIIMER